MTPPPTRSRSHRRGFTLLEMIVVVTIIALLATLVAPKLLSNIGTAKIRKAEHAVNSIYQQVNVWMANEGLSTLPQDFDLMSLAEGDTRIFNEDDLVDPWSNPYELVVPGVVNPDFDIVSYGADGQPGGEDENADITN